MSRQPLEQVQRWMQSVIMHRGGVAEAIESPEVRRHLAISADQLPSVIRPSRSLDAMSRLEIYVDAYYERLLECLAAEFTATRRVLGDELFHALAFGYLQHYPSHSYTLQALGTHFPDYLAESRLHAQEAPVGAEPTWAECIVELAALERLTHEVFDGPGSEKLPPFDAGRLMRLSTSDWQQLRLVLNPSLRLRRFSHPVHVFWLASIEGNDPVPSAPAAQSTELALSRRDYAVERQLLCGGEFLLLEHLAAGHVLAEAIHALITDRASDVAALEHQLPEWFSRWARLGYIVEVDR